MFSEKPKQAQSVWATFVRQFMGGGTFKNRSIWSHC